MFEYKFCFEKNLSPEQLESFIAVVKHPGFKAVLMLGDFVVESLRDEVLTTPISNDPQASAMSIYSKRLQADGASKLISALKVRAKSIVEKYEEGMTNDRT